MTDRIVHVRAAALLEAPPGRTVTVRVVEWGDRARVTDDGVTFYEERFAPGGLFLPAGARAIATDEHFTEPIAHVRAAWDDGSGLLADVIVDEGDEGDALLAELRAGRRSVSAEFFDLDDDRRPPPRAGELLTRSSAVLLGLAFTKSPQHKSARVLAVRSHPTGGTPAMSDTNDTPTAKPTPTPTPAEPTPAPAPATTVVVRSDPAPEPAPVPAADTRRAPVPGTGATARYRSFGEYVLDVARGRVNAAERARFADAFGNLVELRRNPIHARAFEVAVVADMAGLFPTHVIREVIDIYATRTPTVSAFTTGPLPDKGMTITQPIVGDRPAPSKQAAELTEPASNKATIVDASWSVSTYTGGQGMSLQAILRSDPSYVDEVMKLYMREMAVELNTDVAAALLAASDDVNATALEYTTAADFDLLVIDATGTFLGTIHRPAEVVVGSVDLWIALASAKDTEDRPLYPGINPMNPIGRLSAGDAQGNVRDVSFIADAAFGVKGGGISGVVGTRDAFKTLTGPVGTIAADDPETLSRNVAVYQFAAYGKTDATGLMKIANAT
jgi:hypothetical protein